MKKYCKSKTILFDGAIEHEKEPLVPHANAFPSAMMSLGVLMGLEHDTQCINAHGMSWRYDNDYSLHNGVSGEAFRFMFDTAEYFRFSESDGATPLRDCFAAIGTPVEIHSHNSVINIDGVWSSENELKECVLDNLCDGYPVLLLGRTKSDRVLLAIGFDDAGEILIAWTFSPGNDIPNKSFNPQDCQYISNWCQGTDAIALVKGTPSRQTEDKLAELYHRALTRNEKFLRSQRGAPYGEQVNYYDNWIAGLEDETFWSANINGFPYIYPEIWDLAERRSYGASFLVKAAEALHTDKMAPAIEAGNQIHTLMWQINALCEKNKKAHAFLQDPSIRKRIVDILKQCRGLDISMADAICNTLHK